MRDVFWSGFADEVEKLALSGKFVASKMLGRANRLAKTPTASLGARTARQFESVQGTMKNRRWKAADGLNSFEKNMPAKPGVGAHKQELKLTAAKNTASTNSSAVNNMAHQLQGGSVHTGVNITEPLRKANYKSPAFG